MTGSTTASDISNQNVIALNTPLTPANSLDVWNAPGSNLTSPIGLTTACTAHNTSNTNLNTFNQAKLAARGPVVRIARGRCAHGGRRRGHDGAPDPDHSSARTTPARPTAARHNASTTSAATSIPPTWSSRSRSVARDMHIPFARAIDLDIAGRYDNYSDVGSTSNPKFAINWTVARASSCAPITPDRSSLRRSR